jgi:hypothetical protein
MDRPPCPVCGGPVLEGTEKLLDLRVFRCVPCNRIGVEGSSQWPTMTNEGQGYVAQLREIAEGVQWHNKRLRAFLSGDFDQGFGTEVTTIM